MADRLYAKKRSSLLLRYWNCRNSALPHGQLSPIPIIRISPLDRRRAACGEPQSVQIAAIRSAFSAHFMALLRSREDITVPPCWCELSIERREFAHSENSTRNEGVSGEPDSERPGGSLCDGRSRLPRRLKTVIIVDGLPGPWERASLFNVRRPVVPREENDRTHSTGDAASYRCLGVCRGCCWLSR
jgi:hypothetical protein